MKVKGDMKYWLVLSVPLVISFIVLVMLTVNHGNTIYENMGTFIIKVAGYYIWLAVGVEIYIRLSKKGGIRK